MVVSSAPVITVDGPGGSGKGTITQMLARKLGLQLLDGNSFRSNCYSLGLEFDVEEVD